MSEGLRVLIVEDEAIIAMTAEDMLEELGHQVAGVAGSVPEALALVERGGFDLALLDINLNGAQSLPVAEALRARGLPFVFATGYGAAGRGEEFADVPFVTKPYRLKDLSEALEKAAT